MEDLHEKIVSHLDELNRQVAKQNSLSRMFLVGIIYGLGFFVGSAIIATIAFGILGPMFAKVGWVNSAYQTGTTLTH